MKRVFGLRHVSKVGIAALVLAIAGCDATGTSFGGAAQRSALVAAGTMRFTAPSGYCVDTKATSSRPDGGFVLFGSCAALAPLRTLSWPSHPIALAAMVKGAGPETPLRESFPALEKFFRSAAGRSALSRSGQANAVKILAVRGEGDVLLIQLSDRSPASDSAVAQVYWRALASKGGRMVSLSALPRADYKTDDATQIALLLDFVGRIEDLRKK
jgi:hypothetical protein